MRVYYFWSVRLSVVGILINLNTALIPFFECKLLKLVWYLSDNAGGRLDDITPHHRKMFQLLPLQLELFKT